MMYGALFVLMDGIFLNQWLLVDSLDYLLLVCTISYYIFSLELSLSITIGAGSGDFGQGTGPIALSYLQCVGTEPRLIDCPSGMVSCSQDRDVGVRCQTQTGI